MLQSPMTCCFIRQCLFVTFIYHLYFHGHTLLVFFSLFFPCFFSLFACSLHFFLHILVTKENMNTPELNIQESVISSMTPCKGTQILLFFLFFPLLSLSVSYSKRNNQKLHQYKYTRMTSMASMTTRMTSMVSMTSIKVCYNFEAF